MATGSDVENVEADFRLLEDVITSICLQASAMAVAQHGEQATDPEDAASRLRWPIEQLQGTEFGRRWQLVLDARNFIGLIAFAATGNTLGTTLAATEIQQGVGQMASWCLAQMSNDMTQAAAGENVGRMLTDPPPPRPQPDAEVTEAPAPPPHDDPPPPLDDGGIDDVLL